MKFSDWFTQRFLEYQSEQGRRITVKEFAKYLGFSQPSVSFWLNGMRIPDYESAVLLSPKVGAEIFEVLFTTREGTRLSGSGLRQIVRRRAESAHVPEPGLHDFRRTFAIQCLRNGIDLIRLMALMGHTSPTVLQRYLHLVDEDIRQAHIASSPVDNL